MNAPIEPDISLPTGNSDVNPDPDEVTEENLKPADEDANVDGHKLGIIQKELGKPYRSHISGLNKEINRLSSQVKSKDALLNRYISDQEELGRLKEKDKSKKHANTLCIFLVSAFTTLGGVALLICGNDYGKPIAIVLAVAVILVSVFHYFHDTRK